MTVEHVNYSDTLRQGTDKINEAIDQSNEAMTEASEAKSTADEAKNLANSVQDQLNQVVIEGDSSVEAAQARVAFDGTTFTTLKERLDDSDSRLSDLSDIQKTHLNKDFEKFLNYQKPIYSINLLLPEYSDYPQGFAINQEENELYVARQINNGTEVKISRYSLPSCSLIETKSYNKSAGAFQEGLPYFYNDNGDLCFLVWTAYDKSIAIFNFTTGELGQNISVLGGLKMACDKDRKYFISGFGSATRLEGVYIYDFTSVITGSPLLLKTVYFPSALVNGEKAQSLTIIDNKIVVGQGESYPAITVMDFNGAILNTIELDKKSLGDLLKSFDGQSFDTSNFQYENEGVHYYDYNGYIIPLLAHVAGTKLYFTLCGSLDFTEINTQVRKTNSTTGLKWIDVTFASGVSNYGTDVPVQYAKDDKGMVYLRGVATYPRDPGNTDPTKSFAYNKTLFTLPYPYAPKRNYFFKTVASGGADRANRISVSNTGDVILVSVYDQGGSATPFCSLDGIFFYVD